MRPTLALVSAAALITLLAGCGGNSSGKDKDAGQGFSAAADTSTCVQDATQVSAYPGGFPTDFPLPDQTVVYHVQDLGADGIVATGVTPLSLKQVLAALNGPAQDAGFKVTNGETEDHDAEANWSGNGYVGRWAIKDSANCPGEVVVQLLAKKG
ncbi:MAG: hypothetical protein ACR2K3_02255 [Nocardioides sp.]